MFFFFHYSYLLSSYRRRGVHFSREAAWKITIHKNGHRHFCAIYVHWNVRKRQGKRIGRACPQGDLKTQSHPTWTHRATSGEMATSQNAQQNIESAKELLVDRHFYNSFGDIFYDESIKEIMEKIVAEAKAQADGVAEKTGK